MQRIITVVKGNVSKEISKNQISLVIGDRSKVRNKNKEKKNKTLQITKEPINSPKVKNERERGPKKED